jgi:hypothetical protein
MQHELALTEIPTTPDEQGEDGLPAAILQAVVRNATAGDSTCFGLLSSLHGDLQQMVRIIPSLVLKFNL